MVDDLDVRILEGDALDMLCTLPSESVHCIVTSPPFWALRDYGHAEQIGLEPTPEEWCARLVDVFRECRRVLRSDGVMWLEVGDTYAGSWGAQGRGAGDSGGTSTITGSPLSGRQIAAAQRKSSRTGSIPEGCTFKPKDLVGAPWMLAFALRADGWYLRSDTIWSRPNPMPESVTDRPTKAHSYVFLLTKSARYFYDADAIRDPHKPDGRKVSAHPGPGENSIQARSGGDRWPGAGANARSVWSIATEPTPFAHFATFPQALVERCIKAGTSEHGCCAQCGAPWMRQTERSIENPGNRSNNGTIERTDLQRAFAVRRETRVETTGWEPSCEHDDGRVPCTVLDPFMGSGTTALVARRLGRHAVGVELNPEYIAIAAKRLQQLSLLG